MKHGMSRSVWFAALAVVLSGCAVQRATVPEKVQEARSVTTPVRALTDFSDGLVCLGRLLEQQKVETIYMTSDDISDQSESIGKAGYGAKEMMISAISRLSEETGLVRFVAYDRRTPNIVALHNSHPKKDNLRIPDFFVRGGVTQIETSPFSRQKGASLNLGQEALGEGLEDLLGSSLSNSNSVSLSSVTLDLNMGLVSTYQILPGVTSSNTMSVAKVGDSTEVTVSFTKVGGIYSDNENEAGALSSAMRALVEVGVIELMGKLYNVPYETCLAALSADNPWRRKAQASYESMSKVERIQYVAAQLADQNLFQAGQPAVDDEEKPTEALQMAIAAYRAKHGLFASTMVDYRLFERLYHDAKHPAKAKVAAGPVKRWLHADAKN